MSLPEQSEALRQILAGGGINTLFQPIVSLSGRQVFGFEALTRGPSNSALHSPLTLFSAARQAGRLSQLEMACRRSACQAFRRQALTGKLFLNVSPESLLDPEHQPGCTLALLEQAGISPANVVIEITEQTPTDDYALLAAALHHYREMGFSVALDDLGAGYSSLRLWSELRPDYVKIDRYFIENLHLDPVKREFVESILNIARASRTQVIAEGIEQDEELRLLNELGVDLVQGYLVGRPQETPHTDLDTLFAGLAGSPDRGLENSDLTGLLLSRPAAEDHQPIAEILQCFRLQPEMNSLAIVDAQQRPVGIVHRHLLAEALLRPFATDLLARKSISRLMSRDILAVEVSQSLQQVSRLLTSRARQLLEEDFIITQGGRYLGLGRVIDVLRLITELKVCQARHANPLTLLPGNVPIQQYLSRLLQRTRPAVVCYLDIDHFKPFNDIYGYAKGDEVLLHLANCLGALVRPSSEFVGHIGGDDFMLVLDADDWRPRLQQLFAQFGQRCNTLYRPEHLAQGYLVTEGRRGQIEEFPLLSLSAGCVMTAPDRGIGDAQALAALASEAKARAKRLLGDSCWLLDPLVTAAEAQSPCREAKAS